MNENRISVARCRRPVIKIGSAVLAGGGSLDRKKFALLCDDLAAVAHHRALVIVSSGAVALGVERLQLAQRPKDMALKQAAAAAGQSRLMRLYDDELEARGRRCAQVLLTHADIADRGRYLNARRALGELLARGVVPVINENDTVSVEEIKFGDNDALAAMVVDLVEADLLVVLTDAGGVFTKDPRESEDAVRIPLIEKVTVEVEGLACGPRAGAGTGGMITKLRAAKRATEAGAPCAIVPGEPGILPRLFAGEDVGTLVLAQGERKRLRKRWMLDLKARGEILVDDGARTALIERKKSLLPSGVREVRGSFLSGDAVNIATLDGKAFARGLAVYSAEEEPAAQRRARGARQLSLRRCGEHRYPRRQGLRARSGRLLGGRSAAHRRAALRRHRGAARVPPARLRGAPRRPGGDGLSAAKKAAALELASRARAAALGLPARDRGQLVLEAAAAIEARATAIAAANEADVAQAAKENAAFIDRLRLDDKRIAEMARALRAVAALPDPVGEVVESLRRPNGLRVERVRAPLGVVLMIYESRPNVTAEAAALCLRSGNAALLRGGSEALRTNEAIASCFGGDAVQLVPPDRELLDELLQLEEQIDLCIPRGGPSLIRFISRRARVPVIKHYQGVCHLYVATDADLRMAEEIAVNAKVQRPGVCNALECLLVDRAVAAGFLPRLREAMPQVELLQTPDAYGQEFLDLKLAVAVVDGVEGALQHIARYGSRHTEAIVTRDPALAERFLREVDASCVLWNASTRFNDGGELGLGAEIGISTSKLHAYGPMGLRELTTVKFATAVPQLAVASVLANSLTAQKVPSTGSTYFTSSACATGQPASDRPPRDDSSDRKLSIMAAAADGSSDS